MYTALHTLITPLDAGRCQTLEVCEPISRLLDLGYTRYFVVAFIHAGTVMAYQCTCGQHKQDAPCRHVRFAIANGY